MKRETNNLQYKYNTLAFHLLSLRWKLNTSFTRDEQRVPGSIMVAKEKPICLTTRPSQTKSQSLLNSSFSSKTSNDCLAPSKTSHSPKLRALYISNSVARGTRSGMILGYFALIILSETLEECVHNIKPLLMTSRMLLITSGLVERSTNSEAKLAVYAAISLIKKWLVHEWVKEQERE